MFIATGARASFSGLYLLKKNRWKEPFGIMGNTDPRIRFPLRNGRTPEKKTDVSNSMSNLMEGGLKKASKSVLK
jgi:hypothetical protein